MGSNTQFMVDALSMFPEEYGLVDEIYPTSDPQDRFIVVFEDDPRNWSSRLSIAKGLNHLVNVIPLVGTDGATDYVHTEALSTYPLESVKEKTALFLLKELKITGAEYCNVLSKKHFFLCGVEMKPCTIKQKNFGDPRKCPRFLSWKDGGPLRCLIIS